MILSKIICIFFLKVALGSVLNLVGISKNKGWKNSVLGLEKKVCKLIKMQIFKLTDVTPFYLSF